MQVDDIDLVKKIQQRKKALGRELIILTHHYQRSDVVDLGDYAGDSFSLSQTAASDQNARYIVFCGVHFMAESAAILAQPGQTVQTPDPAAGCWMSDMADPYIVKKAWEKIMAIAGENHVTPMAYMNSEAAIKALCGRHDGIVCTSSNAAAAFAWALERREKIFFLPDEHLGRNTADRLGIPEEAMILWDPYKPLGGNTEAGIKKAVVILWKGHCLVHTRFTVGHIREKRRAFPDAEVVTHPECTRSVIRESDAVGSTSFIVNYTQNAAPGSTIVIGTEINLIRRLAAEHPDKTIVPLYDSLCPNMARINLDNLLTVLENPGRLNVVTVDDTVKKEARGALDNMLSLKA
ncbi:MAG: quinolinate synthase NadA [Thermodesulfobacteriota bacterium]|nr:quinolinate synthase NadA [Thermodesulfobacteriota bacterium]